MVSGWEGGPPGGLWQVHLFNSTVQSSTVHPCIHTCMHVYDWAQYRGSTCVRELEYTLGFENNRQVSAEVLLDDL